MIFGRHVNQVKTVCHVENGSSSLLAFELLPLNEFYRRKLVRSITLLPFEVFW